MSNCGGNIIQVCTPGPQGPLGPTGPIGPTGPAGGGGSNGVSIIGNVSGTPALISSGTLYLAGGNNVTLSQNGQSVTISANTAAAANLSVSAGSTSGAFGGLTFSNGSNVSFGLNNGTITGSVIAQSTQTQPAGAIAGTGLTTVSTAGTALVGTNGTNGLSLGLPAWVTAGGIDISAGGNTTGTLALVSSGTLVLAGGNNVTLSQVGNSITISANTAAAANLSVSAGTTTGAFGGLTFANSNNLSFGLNNGTITGTVSVPTGTTFAGTNVSGSMTLNSAGLNLALSGAAGGSGASTGGIYAAGNTTGQSSSSTFAQSSLNISAAGIISAGWSSNTLIISAPGTTGLTQLSAGMSTGGNTAGTTGLASAQLVLAGGANITLSGSTNAGSMTVSIVGGAGGGGGGVGFGVSTAGNTAGATGTVTTGNVVLVGSGPISLSQATGAAGSAATITINGPATSSISGTGLVSISVNGSTISIGANSLGAYAVSNTTQSSSGTVNGTALSFAGAGGVSIGISNGSVVVSGGAGGGGSVNFSAGTTSNNLASLVFSNSNGVSFGLSGSTITASAAGVSTAGLYALGNTTQNSSTTLNMSALSFDALGAMTWGYSNGSIQVSAPATSSISGTGIVSVSVNGSTISIGAAQPQLSFFPALPADNTSATQIGQGSVILYPAFQPEAFTASRADVLASVSGSSSSNSSYAGVISVYMGAYTRTGSTLSLASSGSQSYQFTNTSNNSLGSITGLRRLSVPINVNYTGNQDLYVGFVSQTSSTNANWFTASNIVVPWGNTAQLQGLLGEASNNSKQYVPGMGIFSATSAGMPASIGLSQISGLGSTGQYFPPVNFANFTA